tara:strand:+ start:622 stop:981 length:360 start_codon:yes stop_codon:yes gene_type:complete
MTYSRGSIFVKPHHREVAVIEEPSPHIRASPYQKPHQSQPHNSRGVYAKPHFGMFDVYSPFIERMTNGGRVPGLERKSLAREKTMGGDDRISSSLGRIKASGGVSSRVSGSSYNGVMAK